MKIANAPQVFRFSLPLDGQTTIEMQKGAIILDVLPGKEATLRIAAMVDPEASKAPRTFIVVPTGQPIPHGWDMVFIKTFTISFGGPLIHLFEIPAHIVKKLKAGN